MRMILPLTALALAGCQTKPPPAPPATLPLAEPVVRPSALLPAYVGHYTLGAYVDPGNPLIRHEAHAIQRLETPVRWDLRPTPQTIRTTQHPASPPDKSPPENNEDTPAPADSPGPAKPAGLIGTTVAAADNPDPKAPPARPMPPPDPEPAIVPNADGLIDLTAINTADSDTINPFAVRQVPTDAIHEVTLQLSGVITGAVPCAVVNGHILQTGESVESLVLVRIERDSALFRARSHLLRVPVFSRPTHIRLVL